VQSRLRAGVSDRKVVSVGGGTELGRGRALHGIYTKAGQVLRDGNAAACGCPAEGVCWGLMFQCLTVFLQTASCPPTMSALS